VRAHMAEFRIVAPVGRQGLDRLFAIIADQQDSRVPSAARSCLAMLAEQYRLVLAHLPGADEAARAATEWFTEHLVGVKKSSDALRD
jgi:transposase